MIMNDNENRDYKYMMQDVSHLYLGAKYTYEELINDEGIPFKIKKLINSYVLPELSDEKLSLESHFYYMEGKGFLYQTFLQIKTEIKFSIYSDAKGHFVTKTMKFKDFVAIPSKEKEKDQIMIQEIIFNKLALLSI